tara:strand:+ start:878 stop:1120 length:243 start_codon:yes stop_codon:yes gene_type:complete
LENIGERIKNMKSVNVEVRLRKDENIERALKKFVKKVKKERILEDVRERMYYEKKSEEKRKMKKRRKATLDKLKAQQETN